MITAKINKLSNLSSFWGLEDNFPCLKCNKQQHITSFCEVSKSCDTIAVQNFQKMLGRLLKAN